MFSLREIINMNTKQQTLLNKLSSQYAVNKRLSYVRKQVVNNKIVESIEQETGDSYIVHVDNQHEFDVDFYDDDNVCFTYFFKNDEDYSQYVCSVDECTDTLINQIIRDVTIQQ